MIANTHCAALIQCMGGEKMSNRKYFEDFASGAMQDDIFAKVTALNNFIDNNHQECLSGLGLEILGTADHQTTIKDDDGKIHDVIMLGSNSFLSLTKHPNVLKAAKDACDKYGYGTGAVSLYAGITDLHRELEWRLAALYGKEDAILFPCGYSGNVGLISALCGPGDVIINDAANHASIFDGCVLSGAEIKVYLHANMKHLEKILKSLPESKKGRLIITDGVFSMDGDTAPLDEIIVLAKKYHARIMIDEAHGIGVVGPTGRGTPEKYNCAADIDIIFGTLSKAPGGIGGYCAGSKELIKYLRYYARTYFFSTSIPTPIVAGLIEVIKLIANKETGHHKLWENIKYMRSRLVLLGFNIAKTDSAIIPVIIGDEDVLGKINNDLRHAGVFTNVVTYPAVRRKECRLRLNIMDSLTQQDMDRALALLEQYGKKYRII